LRRTVEALQTRPDCVGWRMQRYSDGRPIGEGIHSITVGHERGKTLVDGTVLYKRTPNHLNPIRREIAASVPFPEVNHGEDWAFMVNVFPMLKSEVFVDEYLYHYYYRMPMAREGERVNR
jgi:hypothetical protein